MKGSHGQLGSRFANRLGCNDADGLTCLDQFPPGEIPAVTFGADPKLCTAGKDRPYLHPVYASLGDLLGYLLINFLALFNNSFLCHWIMDILHGESADYPFFEWLDDLSSFNKRNHDDTIGDTAIILQHVDILGHIHKPPRQISRVSSLESCIRETLPCSVSRYEVL